MAIGYNYREADCRGEKYPSARRKPLRELLTKAEKQAEATQREAILEAKEEIHKLRTNLIGK